MAPYECGIEPPGSIDHGVKCSESGPSNIIWTPLSHYECGIEPPGSIDHGVKCSKSWPSDIRLTPLIHYECGIEPPGSIDHGVKCSESWPSDIRWSKKNPWRIWKQVYPWFRKVVVGPVAEVPGTKLRISTSSLGPCVNHQMVARRQGISERKQRS